MDKGYDKNFANRRKLCKNIPYLTGVNSSEFKD